MSSLLDKHLMTVLGTIATTKDWTYLSRPQSKLHPLLLPDLQIHYGGSHHQSPDVRPGLYNVSAHGFCLTPTVHVRRPPGVAWPYPSVLLFSDPRASGLRHLAVSF